MAKESYKISDIYQGGYSSFKDSYGDLSTGYRIGSGNLGAPTKPDTANQIQQVNQLLNQGIVPIEVGALSPEVFDQIPKQHFKEINRIAKLTGAKISVHAPLVEPSGFAQEGWSEENRELAERQLKDVVERSHDLDSKGGMPITIHSAGIPGTEYGMVKEEGKMVKKLQKLIVVNQETGKLAPLEREEKFYPGLKELKHIQEPKEVLESLNATEWDNSLSQVTYYKEGADRIIKENADLINPIVEDFKNKKITEETLRKFPIQQEAMGHIENADTYLRNASQYLNGLFNKAYKYGTEEDKEKLKIISEHYKEDLGGNPFDIQRKSIAMQNLISGLKQISPELYVPVEDFAIRKASETFSNVAFEAYKKYKNEAPTISIENLYPGMAFSYGEDMKNLIKESRDKFVDKAVKEGFGRGEAEEQAKKMIGMTLDVGHLNIAKKRGFKDEDLKKEVEEIAKYVKHVHLTDNFGYSDSHLPPGMGNVPFKKIFEVLDEKGFKGRTIVEAGGFVQHFQASPFPYVLEAFSSPIYAMKNAPYWNQSQGLQQGYFSGYGNMLPQGNYETFGAGFSQLPMELGGQKPGAEGSRMSGRGME